MCVQSSAVVVRRFKLEQVQPSSCEASKKATREVGVLLLLLTARPGAADAAVVGRGGGGDDDEDYTAVRHS